MLSEGLTQTAERSVGDNTIGILVTDRDAWLKVANDPVYGPQLRAQFDALPNGAYLRLETGLSESTTKSINDAYDTVKRAIEEHNSLNKTNQGKTK